MNRKRTILSVMTLIAVLNFACKKLNSIQTPNYDAENKIFHVTVNADASPLSVSVSQVRPNFSPNPYNSIKAQQYSKFDYGFTPQIGDSIKVDINSSGPMSVSITYLGLPLNAVNVVSTPAGGSTASFAYVVKN